MTVRVSAVARPVELSLSVGEKMVDLPSLRFKASQLAHEELPSAKAVLCPSLPDHLLELDEIPELSSQEAAHGHSYKRKARVAKADRVLKSRRFK